MAESGDQRWRADDIRDTSMQTRLIPLSALEDEGFDVADSTETEAGAASAAPPQPLPPSFYPTNTGRMRPIIVAQPVSAAPSAVATPSTLQPTRFGHDGAPQTAPFGSVAPRTPSATANTSDSLAKITRPSSSSTDSATDGTAADRQQTPAHARISYSLQYRALHPRD